MIVTASGTLMMEKSRRQFGSGQSTAWIATIEGEHYIFLRIRSTEHSFEAETMPDGQWMITVCASDLRDARFETDYVFNQEVTIIGTGSEHWKEYYDILTELREYPKNILILKHKK